MRHTDSTPQQSSTLLSSRFKITFYLLLGLSTAVAFRALIIINHIKPDWVRPLWYFAVLGNFLFFHYRFKITIKRKRAVRHGNLIEAVSDGTPLSPAAREDLLYILQSIERSPENINYLIISLFSLAAIAADLLIIYFSKS